MMRADQRSAARRRPRGCADASGGATVSAVDRGRLRRRALARRCRLGSGLRWLACLLHKAGFGNGAHLHESRGHPVTASCVTVSTLIAVIFVISALAGSVLSQRRTIDPVAARTRRDLHAQRRAVLDVHVRVVDLDVELELGGVGVPTARVEHARHDPVGVAQGRVDDRLRRDRVGTRDDVRHRGDGRVSSCASAWAAVPVDLTRTRRAGGSGRALRALPGPAARSLRWCRSCRSSRPGLQVRPVRPVRSVRRRLQARPDLRGPAIP